jgi:hypothetical protein
VRSDRHPPQTASATAVPHAEQKRPVVGEAQFGQVLAGVVTEDMGPKVTKREALRTDERAVGSA